MPGLTTHRLPGDIGIARVALLVFALATTGHLGAATRIVGSLPRTSNTPYESLPGVDTEYGEVEMADGSKLRTLVTRPQGRAGRLPAVQFVQWLSCDSVEIAPQAHDGWSLMLRRLIVDSGALVLRTEKSGVGDSQGPACSGLDYDTELEQHRQSFRRLRERADVDPQRIVIFGGSMGATYAPLLARGERVAGVVVWGGGARTWFERQLAFDRRAMELSGRPAAELSRSMTRHAEFQWLYLEQHLTPAEIAARRPDLADVWADIVGTSFDSQYGRPFAFHWQAQRQDWPSAWAQVNAPVLVLLGEYDWFEDPRSAELIARIVNARAPGTAEFHLVPGLNHHFAIYPSAEAAYREQGGRPAPDRAMDLLMRWLRLRLQ
jgi:pimeloyl-ACP methyl ester carboxylesterase